MSISLKTNLTSLPKEVDVVQVGREVFGSSDKTGVFSKSILDVICDYIPVEASQIYPARSLLRSFVDFSNEEELGSYFVPSSQGKSNVRAALSVAQKVYETTPVYVNRDQRYGMAFPVDAEVLTYAMQRIQERNGDTVVCEIACARGENGILLAHAGAKEVILNDIDSGAIATLKERLSTSSAQVKKVCRVIEGSCFDLLQKKHKLANRVDLILCRNLLHFFTPQQQTDFFKLITKMLKSGGQAIFTANSVYPHKKLAHEIQLDKCEDTAFKFTHCMIHDKAQGLRACNTLYNTIVPCAHELVDHSFAQYYIYKRNENTGGQWQAQQDEFNKLDGNLRKIIKEKLKERGKVIAKIQNGAVRVVITHGRMFNPTSLMKLFERPDFNVMELFLVDKKGHVVRDITEACTKGQQIGVVVTKP